MAYEPTEWKSGDVVTSAKLNKMEAGIAAGGGILKITFDENGVADKTWKEIRDCDFAFTHLINGDYHDIYYITSTFINDGTGHYTVAMFGNVQREIWYCVTDNENGYPMLED